MSKLLFYDNFQRANTSTGAAGNTTSVGLGWIDVTGGTAEIQSDAMALVAGAYNTSPVRRPWQETPLYGRVVARVPLDGSATSAYLRINDNGQGDYFASYYSGGYLHLTAITAIGGVGDQYTGISTTGAVILQLDYSPAGGTAACTARLFAASCYIDQATGSVLVSPGGAAATPLGSVSLAGITAPGLLIPGSAAICPLNGGQTCTEFMVVDTNPPSNQYAYSGSSLAMGALALSANTPGGGIGVSYSTATGGTSPYTYTLYRSAVPVNSSIGTTDLVSGSGLTLNDPTPLSGVGYYLVTVTDSTGAVATSTQVNSITSARQSCLAARKKQFTINLIPGGDSITFGDNASPITNSFAYLVPAILQQIFPDIAFNGDGSSTWDKGAPGTTSVDWANSTNGASTAAVVAQAQAVPADHSLCPYMIGTNDGKFLVQTSPTAYGANVSTVCAALVAGGVVPVLFAPPYAVPGSNAEWDEIHSLRLLPLYRDQLVGLANGTTIFLGGERTFESFLSEVDAGLASTYFGSGDVHPINPGHQLLAYLVVAGLVPVISKLTGVLPGYSSGGGGGTSTDPGIAHVLAPASGGPASYQINGTTLVGTATIPAASVVLSTAPTYGVGGDGSTGNVALPTTGQVQSGVAFGPGSGSQGTYDPVTGRYTDPGIANVVAGHSYLFAGATMNGSYTSSYPTTSAIASAVVAAMAEAPVGSLSSSGVQAVQSGLATASALANVAAAVASGSLPQGTVAAGSTASSVVVSGLPSGRNYADQALLHQPSGEVRTIAGQATSGGNYIFTFTGTGEAGPFSAVATDDAVSPIP